MSKTRTSQLTAAIEALASVEDQCGTDKLQAHIEAIRRELYAQLFGLRRY